MFQMLTTTKKECHYHTHTAHYGTVWVYSMLMVLPTPNPLKTKFQWNSVIKN